MSVYVTRKLFLCQRETGSNRTAGDGPEDGRREAGRSRRGFSPIVGSGGRHSFEHLFGLFVADGKTGCAYVLRTCAWRVRQRWFMGLETTV